MPLTALVLLVSALSAGVLNAQAILRTSAAAEAEGAQFPRVVTAGPPIGLVARARSGTSERRCVAPPAVEDVVGGLRSGDFVVRGILTGSSGLRAGNAHKVLWLPVHPGSELRTPLLIRAGRVGQPADSLRQIVPALASSGSERGYPSSMEFPTAGEWVVVTTAANDWGCFLLTVGD